MAELKLTEAQIAQIEMARRIQCIVLMTEHGDLVPVTRDDADVLADIIAEFVRAALNTGGKDD